jgi:hypothetical protein
MQVDDDVPLCAFCLRLICVVSNLGHSLGVMGDG